MKQAGLRGMSDRRVRPTLNDKLVEFISVRMQLDKSHLKGYQFETDPTFYTFYGFESDPTFYTIVVASEIQHNFTVILSML